MPTIELFTAFIHMLRHHDWYFEYSDDHRVWCRGQQNKQEIQATAKSHAIYEQAYKAFTDCLCDANTDAARAKRDQIIEHLRNEVCAAANAVTTD